MTFKNKIYLRYVVEVVRIDAYNAVLESMFTGKNLEVELERANSKSAKDISDWYNG